MCSYSLLHTYMRKEMGYKIELIKFQFLSRDEQSSNQKEKIIEAHVIKNAISSPKFHCLIPQTFRQYLCS